MALVLFASIVDSMESSATQIYSRIAVREKENNENPTPRLGLEVGWVLVHLRNSRLTYDDR